MHKSVLMQIIQQKPNSNDINLAHKRHINWWKVVITSKNPALETIIIETTHLQTQINS